MILFPAIDLSGGRVVRLTEGDYGRMTAYGDPLAAAASFLEAGARCLHTVDLDGAKDGSQTNLSIIEKLCKTGLFVQAGGGARDPGSVQRYLDAGVWRVVIGSAAVENPGFLESMAARHPGRIAAGVDAKNGMIAIHGWREITAIPAIGFLRSLWKKGVDTAVYTDISRDGMLMGANLSSYAETLDIPDLRIIASGGVTAAGEIVRMREMGIYGVIVGKALYDGKLSLSDALSAAEGGKPC